MPVTIVNPDNITQTNNFQVVTFFSMTNKFIIEVQKSGSANGGKYRDKDIERLKTYTKAEREFLDYMAAMPEMDLPKTSPQVYELGPRADYIDSASDNVNLVQHMLLSVREELTLDAQTSRMPCGINKFTKQRVADILTQVDLLFDTYVKNNDPLDLPESEPSKPETGVGKTGI